MITIELYQLKKQNNFKAFYSRIADLIPSLKEYVSAKLKISESNGDIETGFYTADDILDDVYLNAFELINEKTTQKDLRRILFDKAVQKIAQNTITEHYSTSDISIDTLLDKELKSLDEPFTVDGDGDLMPNEELDDISYNQEQYKAQTYLSDNTLYEELENNISVNDSSFQKMDKNSVIGELLFNTPPLSSAILELHLFGDLSFNEIAEILNLEEPKVEKVITSFKLKKIYHKST